MPPKEPTDSDLQHMVLGLASAYEQRGMDERRRQTLLALAHIIRESGLVNAGAKDFKSAADEIRATINRQRTLDPDTFEEMARWLNRDFDLFQDSKLLDTIYGGYLAAAGAGATSYLSPWAGMGVAFLTVIGINLPNPLESLKIPPVNPFDVLALDTWAIKRLYDLAEESGGAAQIMAELYATGDISLNPGRKASEAVIALPQSIRNLVKERVEGKPAKPASEVKKEAQDEAKELLVRIEERVTQLEERLKDERNAAVRAFEEAAARREIEYLAAELNGLGALGGLALTLLGDKTAARAFRTVTQAGASAWLAIAMPGLGPLAIAGALAGAADAILGLFSEGDPLYNALEPIHRKLDYIIERLDLVVEQQITILQTLAEIYKNVQTSGTKIKSVQDSIRAYGKSSADTDVDGERREFVSARDDLASLLRDHPAEKIAAEPVLQNQYRTNMRSFYTYGHNIAGSTAHSGALSTGLTNGEWVEEIRRRGRVDRLVGILPAAAADLRIDLGVKLDAPDAGRLVNPIAWREAVQALLEGRLALPSVKSPSEITWLTDLWRDGNVTRQIIVRLTSPAALAGLAAKLKAAAGVPDSAALRISELMAAPTVAGAVYRAALEVDSRTVPRTLNWKTSGTEIQSSKDPWRMRGRPYADQGWGSLRIRFEPDFVQALLDHGIDPKDPARKALELVSCEPLKDFQQQCTIMIRLEGPYKDSPLVPEKLALSGNQKAYPATVEDVIQLRSPFDIQARAQSLYFAAIVRPQFGPQASTAVRTALAQKVYPDFEYWGEVTRTLSALISWRLEKQQERESLMLGNAQGPFSREELGNYLSLFATSRLSPSGDWPLELAAAVSTCVDESLDPYRQTAIVNLDTVSPLDESIRRLASYMDSRGISLTA